MVSERENQKQNSLNTFNICTTFFNNVDFVGDVFIEISLVDCHSHHDSVIFSSS